MPAAPTPAAETAAPEVATAPATAPALAERAATAGLVCFWLPSSIFISPFLYPCDLIRTSFGEMEYIVIALKKAFSTIIHTDLSCTRQIINDVALVAKPTFQERWLVEDNTIEV
jgi:hypothetical protein